MRAIARFVRDQVRYVDVGAGAGNWRPRSASETLSSLYGDSKDKVTLMRSMLAAQGITAWPMLVNANEKGTIAADVPSIDCFDHVIAGVVVSPDVEIPAWARAGLVDAGHSGNCSLWT